MKPVGIEWKEAGRLLDISMQQASRLANMMTSWLNIQDAASFVAMVDPTTEVSQSKKTGSDYPKLPPIPKGLETQLYQFARSIAPHWHTHHHIGCTSKAVYDKWKAGRFDDRTGRARLPSYRGDMPLGVKGGSYKLAVDLDDADRERLTLTFSLFSKLAGDGAPKSVSFLLDLWKLRNREHVAAIRRIVTGEDKAARIQVSRKRSHGTNVYLVHIPVRIPVPERAAVAGRTCDVFPPGGGKFLRCAMFAKFPPKRPEDCWREDLDFEQGILTQRVYQVRRAAMSREYRQSPTGGANGHGLHRAVGHKERLATRYKNRVRCLNRQRAAHIVNIALRWKCETVRYLCPSSVPLEGFNLLASWPWYQLKECVRQACENSGLEFVEATWDEQNFLGMIDGSRLQERTSE